MALINSLARLTASGLNPAAYVYNAVRTHDATPGFNLPWAGSVITAGVKSPGSYNANRGRGTTTQANESSPNNTGVYTGDSQAAAQAAANAKAIASYNQSIQNQQAGLGRQNTVLDASVANAQNAYNDTVNQLNQQKALNQQTYNKNVGQTKQDYVSAKNTISTQAGNSLNSLLRLLGARGAGGSSAALYGAPQAVTRQATLQRNDTSSTYGKNMQNLDTGWNNYLNAYQQNLTAADRQRQNDINQSKAKVRQSQASILQQLADLYGKKASVGGGSAQAAANPYLAQANAFLDQAARLGKGVAVPKVAPAVYTAPDLADYTVNPNASPMVDGQTQTADYTSPYLAALLGKKDPNTAALVGA